MPVIEIESLSFRYRAASKKALENIDLEISDGEFVVIMGPNEAGKSTLCFTLNGLIPHLIRGAFEGSVSTHGNDTRERNVKDLFPHIGLVFQDFEAQLFSTEVELEVAFGPENLGLPLEEIRTRVSRALELTRLAHLKGRQPATLSGGQKQLLAIASVLSLEPRILCLDEPTTDLDPINKRSVFELARRLFEHGRQTLVVVEHETEEVLGADHIVLLREGRIAAKGPPDKILRNTRLLEECHVMPLHVTELFEKLRAVELPLDLNEAKQIWQSSNFKLLPNARRMLEETDSERARGYGRSLINVKDVHFSYEGKIPALKGVSLEVREGEFAAILGQNGSGKTTLAKHLNGLLKPAQGDVNIDGGSTSRMSSAELGRKVGYVFQNPDHQIFEETILDEVLFGPRHLGLETDPALRQAQDALETVGLWERRSEDPFTLTKGLRQKVAVASVLATRPPVIIMDEPTTGLDYGELKQMMALVEQLNRAGHTIIIITHCIWIAAKYAHRTILMSEGEIVADGPTREIFEQEDLLARADIIAPQIVRFSNSLGTTVLSVEEFIKCTEHLSKPDEDPVNADRLKELREERKKKE